MGGPRKKSISRNLGAFFGHIVKAIATDPTQPESVQVKKTVTEEQQQDGVLLRRTTIDEVIIPPKPDAPSRDKPKP